ncbi:IS66 family insertion sequence element accessory protein TnpA [Roseateles sp. GG27B]
MKKVKRDWQGHIEAIKAQGISIGAYALLHGPSRAALYRWQSKLRATAAQAAAARTEAEPAVAAKPPGKFLALRVMEPHGGTVQLPAHCTLLLPGGMRLELPALPDPQWLAALGWRLQGER